MFVGNVTFSEGAVQSVVAIWELQHTFGLFYILAVL